MLIAYTETHPLHSKEVSVTVHDTDHLPVRTGDPTTSYMAAIRAVAGASGIRPVVLRIVREHGPLTHDEIIRHYRHLLVTDPDTPPASDQGIRSRTRELVIQGAIRPDAERGLSVFGNSAQRWIAIDDTDMVALAQSLHRDSDWHSHEHHDPGIA